MNPDSGIQLHVNSSHRFEDMRSHFLKVLTSKFYHVKIPLRDLRMFTAISRCSSLGMSRFCYNRTHIFVGSLLLPIYSSALGDS